MRWHLFTQKDSLGSQKDKPSGAAPEELPVLRRPVFPAWLAAGRAPHTPLTPFQVSRPQ